MGIKEIIDDFASLIYPNYCLGCSQSLVKGEQILCTKCLFEIPKTNHLKEQENTLYNRLITRISLQHAFAYCYFKKGSRVQTLLHALKYENHPEIGHKMGKVFGYEMKEEGYDGAFDIIVPVPLHPSRKRARGYNQSEEFAKGLSEALEIPYSDSFVIRTTKTSTQTKKTKLNRWENVKEVFRIEDKRKIEGKKVLLVDDVVTTGATLEACATPLLHSACSSVSVACIAMA